MKRDFLVGVLGVEAPEAVADAAVPAAACRRAAARLLGERSTSSSTSSSWAISALAARKNRTLLGVDVAEPDGVEGVALALCLLEGRSSALLTKFRREEGEPPSVERARADSEVTPTLPPRNAAPLWTAIALARNASRLLSTGDAKEEAASTSSRLRFKECEDGLASRLDDPGDDPETRSGSPVRRLAVRDRGADREERP